MRYNVFDSIEQSIVSLWFDVISFLPELLVAILVLIIGWIVGGLLGKLVGKVLKVLHLDSALDKAGVDALSERAGFKFKPTDFVSALVKWFVIIAFALVSFDILRLYAVTDFMQEVVLGYLPSVFAAVLILFASVLVANLASKALVGLLRSGGTNRPEVYGRFCYALVIGFGIMATLNQLRIAEELVQTLFTGIIFALSLGLGLAFGLGGKNVAGRYLEEWTSK